MSRRVRPAALLLAAALVACLVATLLPGVDAAAQEATSDGRYRAAGDPGGFSNIMPPGQQGGVNGQQAVEAQGGTLPEHFNDQTAPYADLVFEGGFASPGEVESAPLGVSDGDERTFFKDASFGFEGEVEREYSPGDRDDVVVLRDAAFGVPHIFGETREGAMFATGYATAEDRFFLMDALRHVGRGRLSEFLGASPGNIAMDVEQLEIAPYRESELTQQVEEICALGENGQRACDDAEAYIAGVNQYVSEIRSDPSRVPAEYPALQQVPQEFVVEDIVAIASLVGGIFGVGGGSELQSGRFLSELQEFRGEDEGRAIWEDFRSANDPEAPVTTNEAFPYNNPTDQLDPATTALVDPDSIVSAIEPAEMPGLTDSDTETGVIDGPFGPMRLALPTALSNAVLVDAEHSDGGVPAVVFGPQTGYFTPQLLVETDVHAPGIDARGVGFAGTNLYVQLGRGNDYAFSATSASADNSDDWVSFLCEEDGSEPSIDSTSYMYDGECRPMDTYTHRQVAKPTAAGMPEPGANAIVLDIPVARTLYGPVQFRATVDGEPVAISNQRSTYGAELKSAVGFQLINDPEFMADGVEGFNAAFDEVEYTFNWFYVDRESIAYKHSCLCPLRDPVTDPDLPTIGDGAHNWTGQEIEEGVYEGEGEASGLLRGGEFLAPEDQPQDVDPEQGYLVSWNNKQAPGFRANDSQFSYSSTYRSRFLEDRLVERLEQVGKVSRADVVNIMEDAGTADLNGDQIYPRMLAVLDAGDVTPSGRQQALLDLLRDWVDSGGHRRDADRDGTYEHAVAISIGDALVRPLLEAVEGDELGDAAPPQGIEDHPRKRIGSAFNGGRMNFLEKDFRQVTGEVEGERSRTYCGDGTPAGCSEVILSALDAADAILSSTPEGDDACAYPDSVQFSTDEMDEWVYDARCDDIDQSALGLVDAPNIPWINRPTFQQVIQVGSRIGRLAGRDRVVTSAAVSRQGFPESATAVVLASAATFPDALTGTPLAIGQGAPLLLTPGDRLSPVIADEIERLGANSATVLGGTAALSEQVVTDLEEMGLTVTRLGGANRFATAALIAESVTAAGSGSGAIVASGANFPDALAAGPYAGLTGQPILLTAVDSLPPETAALLDDYDEFRIAGGTAAVNSDVEGAFGSAGTVTRTGGVDRYATARMFTDLALGEGVEPTQTYLVTGTEFPDALSAGAASVAQGGALALVTPDRLGAAPETAALLEERRGDVLALWMVGGQEALTPALRAEVEEVLGRDPRSQG